jgi:quinohemoprotein ethanol dehydrogenase
MKTIQTILSKIRAAAGRAPKPALAATLLLAAVGACNLVGPSGPAAVNSDRMHNADSEENVDDWMSYGRTYDEQRFSPLDQINDSNVDQLGLAWYDDLDTLRGVEGTPLVIDGVIYNTSAFNIVTAYNGATGEELWTYDPKVNKEWARLACCGPSARGIAAWNGKIYIGALDGRLIAVDAKTGEEVWTTKTFETDWPFSITGAPRVFDGKVVIGNGGADYGVRGFVSAYDAETGKQLWKFYIVPGNPADAPDGEASDSAMKIATPTWNGNWWEGGGGGTAWDSLVYDPELNLVYIGTGNGAPHVDTIRSPGGGDNLFLCSIVAVNADTGEYVWHYQMVPAESWDFTCTQPMMLADLDIKGKKRQVVMQAPKNGFFYVLDRKTGELLSAETYVPNTWATRIDMKTGRPVETENARLTFEPTLMTPTPLASHSWHPMAYNPNTGLVYFPAHEQWMVMAKVREEDFKRVNWRNNSGLDWVSQPEKRKKLQEIADSREKGFLIAWDPVKQKEAFRVNHIAPGSGGVLTTQGNLLFQGTPEKDFAAYRADNGKLLWKMPVQNVPIAGPVTYMIDGVQYIAVNTGWAGQPSSIIAKIPGWNNLSTGRLMVFKLGGQAKLPPLAPQAELPRPPRLTADETVVRQGAKLFAETCSTCHGKDARGGMKDLRWMTPETHAEFFDIVLGGKRTEKGMASFADILSKEQAEAIHQYLIARANEDWAEEVAAAAKGK